MLTKARGLGIVAAFLLLSPLTSTGAPEAPGAEGTPKKESYHANLVELTRSNTAYRRVLFTGQRMQVVAMSIPPGGDIGLEQHNRVEQVLVCVEGRGQVLINGIESPFEPGDVVVVTPGSHHNFMNRGAEPLKLYTIYSPPNHIDGRVQQTKADAEADLADIAFGLRMEGP